MHLRVPIDSENLSFAPLTSPVSPAPSTQDKQSTSIGSDRVGGGEQKYDEGDGNYCIFTYFSPTPAFPGIRELQLLYRFPRCA